MKMISLLSLFAGCLTGLSQPWLGYSTYLGGSNLDTGDAVAVDASGYVYVAGTTMSTNLPGAVWLPGSSPGSKSVFVAKFDPTGLNLVYLALLGGSGDDQLNGLALDGTNVWLTGFTRSEDFPLVNPLQATPPGGNAFVAKLNGSGTALLFSTCLGGSAEDSGEAITVDKAGKAWVTGWTESADFPAVLPNQDYGGGRDAFVAEIAADGSKLLYSTWYGGSGNDTGQGIALAPYAACIVGFTDSPNLSVTNGGWGAPLGGTDAFVAALWPNVRGTQWATYLGGENADYGLGIAINDQGDIFVAGQTYSTNFWNFWNTTLVAGPGGNGDAFVAKVTPTSPATGYTVRFGGTGEERAQAIAVDAAGRAYVCGYTASADFPTVQPWQPHYGGGPSDAFLAVIESGGMGLAFSSFVGSAGRDSAAALALDASGKAWFAGTSRSSANYQQFPITPEAWQSAYGGGLSDAFLAAATPTPAGKNNDDFAAATLLAGTRLTVLGSNVGASREALEPLHAGVVGGKSVWWRWQAPTNGSVVLSTLGSDFDTLLAVYTGDTVGALTPVAANDDDSVHGVTSRAAFNAVAGANYAIAVDGKAGASGQIVLTIVFPCPPNDDFAYRIAITSLPATVAGSNVGATYEEGEPPHSYYATPSTGRSVWWSWTAPEDMKVSLDTTDSDFTAVVAVYTGESLANLSLVLSNGDHAKPVWALVAKAGTTYQIAVDGNPWSGSEPLEGNIVLRMDRAASPANDDFAGRADLSAMSLPLSVTADNTLATREPGEPPPWSGLTLWWTWTAPRNGTVTATATGDLSPALGVYTGSSLAALTLVDANSYAPFQPTFCRVSFKAVAGTAYQLVVDGHAWDYPGPIALQMTWANPPPNDDFASAQVMSGEAWTATGTNADATREPGEPDTGSASVWWSWTAPTNGNVELRYSGSLSNYIGLTVYTGDALAELQMIAQNGQALSEVCAWPCMAQLLTFKAEMGRNYRISVGTWGPSGPGPTGPITLELRLVAPPPNDDFAQAVQLAGMSNVVHGANLGATRESGEPWHGRPSAGGKSVWYRWTAPATGVAVVELSAPPFPLIMAAYTGESVDSLDRVAQNLVEGSSYTNRFGFTVSAGTTYRLAVDSLDDTGQFAFTLVDLPALEFTAPVLDAQGRFESLIQGTTTKPFVIQVSSDLLRWTPVATNLLANGQFRFQDLDSVGVKHRFYRAVEEP